MTVRLGRSVNGADGGEVRFSVAGVARAGPGPPAQPVKGPPRNVQRFGSRPDLRPPAVEVSTPAKGVGHGAVFVAPKMSASQRGPMIIDPSGELVWFHPLAGTAQAFDFRAQTYDGKPVLTWWEGTPADFHGRGVGRIYDTTYQPLATVRAGNGYEADLHEFELTPRGTAWIAVYEPVPQDLSSVGGPKNGTVYDQIVQEIDVKTGAVLFEWHSVGNIELSESYQPLPKDAKRATTRSTSTRSMRTPTATYSSPPGTRKRSTESTGARPRSNGDSAASGPRLTQAERGCSPGSTTLDA